MNQTGSSKWIVPKGEKKKAPNKKEVHCYIVEQNQAFLFLEYYNRYELYYRSANGPVLVRTDAKSNETMPEEF